MADESQKAKTDYSSNSSKNKTRDKENSTRPEVKQIVAGKAVKKSIRHKFKETFAGDSAESVGQYVLFDVIVPRVKDLLFDTFTQGLERSLFGSSTRSSVARPSRSGKTDYQGISSKLTSRNERDISARGRATHNFEEILIPTRGEAEQVLDTMLALIDQYDSATVADLYHTVGITTDHTDLKFGWMDLTEARISAARGGGYILELPRAIEI